MSAFHPIATEQLTQFYVCYVPETDMQFASLGRAFQADGRGFSPIEGGREGGGSVSRSTEIK
jgi:hypothetical protein